MTPRKATAKKAAPPTRKRTAKTATGQPRGRGGRNHDDGPAEKTPAASRSLCAGVPEGAENADEGADQPVQGPWSRVEQLRADFELLGTLLAGADGSGAAAIARERRIIGELLEALETPERKPKVDEVAERRRAKAGAGRPPARRRQSG